MWIFITWTVSLTGNRLPLWRAPPPAVTGPWPWHHRRACVAVFLQGGSVLRGDCGVPLLPSSGLGLCIVSKPPGDRPHPLRTARGPGWPGGGHSAPYLRHQHQPANNTGQRRTLCKCYHPTRCDGEFTVDGCCCRVSVQAVWHGLLLDFFLLPVARWISRYNNIDSTTARNSWDVGWCLSLSDSRPVCQVFTEPMQQFKIQCYAMWWLSFGYKCSVLKFLRPQVFGW